MNVNSSPVALITGAVGNLGAATARAFQGAGCRTILVDRSQDRLESAFPDLAGHRDHFLAGGVDLTDATAVAGMVAAGVALFGRIDTLVNTVGAWHGGKPLHEDDPAKWDLMYNLNVRTMLVTCRAVVPQMLRQGSGAIINISSRDGLAGSAGYGAYSAAKSAVLRWTEALAAELKHASIRVNCILPGTIDTPQNRQAMPSADFARWVAPEALAAVICFLASDAARAVYGAAIPVYGKG